MPTYTFSDGVHKLDYLRPIGTEEVECRICGAGAKRLPSFGVIPNIKGSWAHEFHWSPDLKANHEEALGSFREAREILAVERANGLKA